MSKKRINPNYRRRLLRLPDLDHCKRAVLNSLGSPASRRVYEFAIDQFIAWYCSEPRLALTASWSSVIACILNQEVWPQVRERSKSHKSVGCSILPAMSFALRGRDGKRTPVGVSPPSKCEVLSTLRYRTGGFEPILLLWWPSAVFFAERRPKPHTWDMSREHRMRSARR
jgi:hypothetical protein